MTIDREEAEKVIRTWRDALVKFIERDFDGDCDWRALEAMTWAARLLDSGADCVSPDNATMLEEIEMATEWMPGKPVLLNGGRK